MNNILEKNSLLEKEKTKGFKGDKSPPGRPKGTTNNKTYKWKVVIFDNETKSFKEGKYTSVNHINKELGFNLNADYVRRIMTKYRADISMRNKENSFLARYGHIHIEKINEPVKS
jgi:hypothetical protein